jgi:glutamyl-tRNA reductase
LNTRQIHLIVLGLNHTTAPVDVREKLFIPEESQPEVLKDLKTRGADEAAIISTCNRTEFYVSGAGLEEANNAVLSSLTERFGIDKMWLRAYTYTLGDEEAYRHLFLVASGLDSMVVGEPQILGQVKDAYRMSRSYDTSGPFFEKVFKRAFQVAKRVRTETKIGYNPVSISSMAVELARKIFGELAQKQILVIGAGEMCEIALKHFRKEGLQEILVTNRTFRKARQLAEEIIGTAYPFEEVPELLLKVDMVLSSTGAEKPIIDKKMIMTAMKKRKNRALFFIDIAVPRDVEQEVNDLENVYLYDIDDLKEISQTHLSNRVQESQKAHAIVDEEVEKFDIWLKQLEMNPLIAQIVQRIEQIRSKEVRKAVQKLKNPDPDTIKQVDMLSRTLINKLMHPHMMMIKKNGSSVVLDVIKNLLLPEEEDEKETDSGDEGE